MREQDPRLRPESHLKNERNPLRRYLPFLIFGVIGLLIASQEIPVVHDAVQSVISPDKYQAGKMCRDNALQLSNNLNYARIVDAGQIHATQSGFFVENIVVGEMSEQGGELRFSVDCYADSRGNVVRAVRK